VILALPWSWSSSSPGGLETRGIRRRSRRSTPALPILLPARSKGV
jgi:hypothetical protein